MQSPSADSRKLPTVKVQVLKVKFMSRVENTFFFLNYPNVSAVTLGCMNIAATVAQELLCLFIQLKQHCVMYI